MIVLDSDTEALKIVGKGHPRLSQQPRDYISRKTQVGLLMKCIRESLCEKLGMQDLGHMPWSFQMARIVF